MYQPDIFVNILIYKNDSHLLCSKTEEEYEKAYRLALLNIGLFKDSLRSIKIPYCIRDGVSQALQPNSYFTPGYHIVKADIDAIWEVSIVTTRSDFQCFPDEYLINNEILKSIPGSPHISYISLNQDLKVLACHYKIPLKTFKVLIWDQQVPLRQFIRQDRMALLESYRDLLNIEFCEDFDVIIQECQDAENSDDIGLLDPLWDEYPLIVVSYDECPEKPVGRFAKQVAQTVCDIVSHAWHPLNDFVPEVYCKDDRGFFEQVTLSRDVLECANGFAFLM